MRKRSRSHMFIGRYYSARVHSLAVKGDLPCRGRDLLLFAYLVLVGLVAFVRANAVVNMSSVGDFYGG